MQTIIGILIQILIVLLLAPLVNGITNKVKAFVQKRKGAPILQMYFDLYKLFKKDTVISNQTSWIFKAAPYIVFSTAVLAFIFVPIITEISLPIFAGDFILVIYVLAMGKFFMALSGMDAASTFGGMGSSREMTISALIEPGLIVSLFTIGLISHSSSVGEMVNYSQSLGLGVFQPVYILLCVSLFITLIAETARTPVDDPATHLELTMIHEAMVLEYSGKHLALMEWGSAVKQLLLITLIANLFFPFEASAVTGIFLGVSSLLIYVAKVAAISVLVAIVETLTVKLKFFSVPNIAALSFIVALIGFMQYFVLGGI